MNESEVRGSTNQIRAEDFIEPGVLHDGWSIRGMRDDRADEMAHACAAPSLPVA
jgi:hypothetical protein